MPGLKTSRRKKVKGAITPVVGAIIPSERGQASDRPNQDRPYRRRRRRSRCDCGRLAVTVLTVRVGIDGAYTVRLPLCAACLELERKDG